MVLKVHVLTELEHNDNIELHTGHSYFRSQNKSWWLQAGKALDRASPITNSLRNLLRNHFFQINRPLGMATLTSWAPETPPMYTQQDIKQVAYSVYPVPWTY